MHTLRIRRALGQRDHAFDGAAAEYFLPGVRCGRKDPYGRNRSVSEGRHGLTKERIEGTGTKFNSEKASGAFVLSDKAPQLHAVNPRAIRRECQLNTGVRQKFTRFGGVRVHTPALEPKVLDPLAQLRRRCETCVMVAETYRKLFESIPAAKDSVEVLESAGKRVYAQFVLSGHWNGMQDKPITVRIMSAYTVRNGRIIDDATYYDRK